MAQLVLPSTELLRESTDEELNKVIEESHAAILEIRTLIQYTPNPKTHLIKAHKKLIARCKTILNNR